MWNFCVCFSHHFERLSSQAIEFRMRLSVARNDHLDCGFQHSCSCVVTQPFSSPRSLRYKERLLGRQVALPEEVCLKKRFFCR